MVFTDQWFFQIENTASKTNKILVKNTKYRYNIKILLQKNYSKFKKSL